MWFTLTCRQICSNPDCRLSETGTCVEGTEPPDNCAFYGATPSEEIAQEGVTGEEAGAALDESVNSWTLPTGELMDIATTESLLKGAGGILVACVGPSEVGKTTLFASLFDELGHAPIGVHSFGGSATVYAYERLCHLARLASKGQKPDTERTLRTETAKFLHLALSSPMKARVDLIFADRAGEEYESAADASSECAKLFEVKRADVILLLVDAQELSDNKLRHVAKDRVVKFAKAILAIGWTLTATRIAVVMTRYDLAVASGTSDQADAELHNTFERLQAVLPKHIPLTTLTIAARPRDSEPFHGAYGLAELLDFLVADPTVSAAADSEIGTKSRRFFHTIKA